MSICLRRCYSQSFHVTNALTLSNNHPPRFEFLCQRLLQSFGIPRQLYRACSHDSKSHTSVEATKNNENCETLKPSKNVIKINVNTAKYYERNFVTKERAFDDFALDESQLVGLRKAKRRTANEGDAPLTVYWQSDVEQQAIKVHGSLYRVERIKRERRREKQMYRSSNSKSGSNPFQFIFRKTVAKVRNSSGTLDREKWPVRKKFTDPLSSHRVVFSAVFINSVNTCGKLFAWALTGSHSMFSEAIHSIADTLNQVILLYGIWMSAADATEDHPYGFSNMQYVSSLISGVAIFFMGAGVSTYHGITGLHSPIPIESLSIAYVVLAGSFVTEGITLALAVKSIRRSAGIQQMTFWEYVYSGQDPCVNVVFLEDLAAVSGVLVAASSLALSSLTESTIPDSIGSLVIGGILASVASFMILSNSDALVGRSISNAKLRSINEVLEADIMVRQVHDVKGIDMGNGIVRYKAELDIDGRELAMLYLRRQNLTSLLEQVKSLESEEEIETFMLRHGENIVDSLGEQVDRIEKQLKASHPEVKHVDLEVL